MFSFFVYNSETPISDKHLLWNHEIPTERQSDTLVSSGRGNQRITYGEYFEAISFMLKLDNFKLLKTAIVCKSTQDISTQKMNNISIFLEKHGSFYHPSKLKIHIGGQLQILAANMAISREGRNCMSREVSALRYLNRKVKFGFLPQIYAYCFNQFISGRYISVFLCEWFVDFNEFHLSIDAKLGTNGFVIWSESTNYPIISEKQAKEIYLLISMILSLHYDLMTTRHIFPWHNASGDFVVRINSNSLEVRLITARGFGPMLMNFGNSNQELSESEIIYALLIFFLNTSIRIRMDRLNGVGKLVLADRKYVLPIVKGFFEGLFLKIKQGALPPTFVDLFKSYILSFHEKELFILASEITNKIYKRLEEEKLIIFEDLSCHVSSLLFAVREEKISSTLVE